MLKDKTLTVNGQTFDISAFGGVRWDGDKRKSFFVDVSGKPAGYIEGVRDVSQYREIEAACVPYWRSKGQCIE